MPKDKVDPDLVKLERTRSKIGVITSAGMVILCVAFAVRLLADRSFAGAGDTPEAVTTSDVLAGKVSTDELVELEAEPVFAHGIRAVKTKGDLGSRLVPVRGTGDRLWLALQGDPYDPPAITSRYVGRLRKLSDVNYAKALGGFTAEHPRPVFAPPAAIRAAFASGKLKTVAGEEVAVADGDRVMFELAEPNRAVLVVSLGGLRPNARTWTAALDTAGVKPLRELAQTDIDKSLSQLRFEVAMPIAEVAQKLTAADFFGVRTEAVTTRFETTWGALKQSPPEGLSATTLADAARQEQAHVAVTPDAQVDLVGVFALHGVPDDAYALLTGERPGDYWYVMPIIVILVGLSAMFLWAFVRAVRRDILPTRA